MVITPNNHQRVVHMRMLDWFFVESTDSHRPILDPSNRSEALLRYLSDRKLLENDLSLDTIDMTYLFTIDDVRFLLINRFDLSDVNYSVEAVSPTHFEKLYNIAYVNQLPLTVLHGLQVDFSQKDSMRHLNDFVDDFISKKTPIFFKHLIIDLRELTNIAKNPNYHDWLSNDDMQLTISYYDEDKGTQQKTTIDTQKFHDAMASFSSSRVFKDKATAIDLIRDLSANILHIDNPSTTEMSKGELFLTAAVCAFHSRNNPISSLFWETQIEKAPAAKEQPCRESDITLLSKIRNC